MQTVTGQHTDRRARVARRLPAVAGLLGVGFLLAGCSAISAIHHAVSAVEGNKKIVDTFEQNLKTTPAQPFQATYVTTGSTPTTIVYAVDPPDDVAFSDTPTGGTGPAFDLIQNATGEYECTPASGGGSPTCQKLGKTDAATENAIVDFYTPSHWKALLSGGSLVAGLAGDTVTTSTKSVNGFTLTCINLKTPGGTGTGIICTTSQGLLGYAQVASDSTSFEITKYTTSPPSSAFKLPAGAKVTDLGKTAT